MRIKHYLAILIITCLGLGYGMEALLSDYHRHTQMMIKKDYQYDMAIKDIERLNDDVLQYIISIDLILGSDQNYLLPGALKKGHLIIQTINTLKNSILNEQHTSALLIAKTYTRKINALLNQSRELDYDKRQEDLYSLLSQSDEATHNLLSIIEKTLKNLREHSSKHKIDTEKNIKKHKNTSNTIRIIYGIIILIFWLWINRRISLPIEKLMYKAKKMEEGKDVEIEHTGPTEVSYLSQQFESTAKKLLKQALSDPLTDLHNRREFTNKIKAAFSKEKKSPHTHQLCICIIDLDRFKAVNDNCGHSAGDKLLILAATEIQHAVANNCTVARIGGDEFGLLFSNTSRQECINRVDDILDRIRNIHFEKSGSIYRISASIGMTFVTDPNISTSEWVNTADAGCFVAKNCGRDSCQIMKLNDERLRDIRNDTKVYNEVVKAFEEDRFVLYYQHINGLQDNNKTDNYFEVLVRMISEEGDIVSPYYFMSVIERFDLAARLDRWVVNNTIHWLKENPEALSAIDTVSINLSGKSLASKEMHQFLVNLIRNSGVPAYKLCFEVTETAAVNDINQAQLLIASLRAIGCRFALDDFGSGLSSFTYLRTLKVDVIKIDGAFIKSLIHSNFDQVMVNNINELAKNLQMKTVAEFVENQETADKLNEMGIHYAQGYHFHQPSELAEFNSHRFTNHLVKRCEKYNARRVD